MNGCQIRVGVLAVALAVVTMTDAQIFDPASEWQTAHDQTRLERARRQSNESEQDRLAAQARRTSRRKQLDDLGHRLDALTKRYTELDQTRYRMGEDMAQVYALARTSAQDHASRLRAIPQGDAPERNQRKADALAAAPTGLDGLYEVWYALHGELAASAEVQRFELPVTFVDGVRQTTLVTRFGSQLLVARGQRVESHGAVGLVQSPLPLPAAHARGVTPPGAWRFVRPAADRLEPSFVDRRFFESGWVGLLILLCAAAGIALVVFQSARLVIWRSLLGASRDAQARLQKVLLRRRAHLVIGDRYAGSPGEQVLAHRIVSTRDRNLRLFASAAMLLGLLGTVVGLIQTFRSLALFGGTEATLAAAGISHALATTWLGLSVAIPLLLCQVALAAWRRRVENRVALRVLRAAGRYGNVAGQKRLPTRPIRPARWRRRIKNPFAIGAGTALAFLLFLFMQWLIDERPVTPQTPDRRTTIARIEWQPEAPQRPRRTRVSATQDDERRSYSAAALPALGALATPDLPTAGIVLPILDGSDRMHLAGMRDGGSAFAAVGGEWLGADGEGSFAGVDLVPISSARPKYPRAAALTKTEGWVELVFTISASGDVANIRVIDAEPPGVFENAAANAMSKWLYAPLYRNGQPVTREATQLFRFRAADIQELYLYDGG